MQHSSKATTKEKLLKLVLGLTTCPLLKRNWELGPDSDNSTSKSIRNISEHGTMEPDSYLALFVFKIDYLNFFGTLILNSVINYFPSGLN